MKVQKTSSSTIIELDATEREIVYDALRFARDEFVDDNGLPLSNAEYDLIADLTIGDKSII
jgi:hypothetical protein